MQRNRRPLNPEHQLSHLPMSGIIRARIQRLFQILAALLVVQVLIIWSVEDLTLFESAWMTMTTLVTVGYGDFAPQTTLGRLSTVVLMFISAITVMTLIVSDYIEKRFYDREKKVTGRWIYPMKDHIVIINTPKNGGEQYFARFASQVRAVPGYKTVPIMLLTQEFPQGLPTDLSEQGLVHFHGSGSDPAALKAVKVGDARHVIVLAADEANPTSDSLTFDIAHRLNESNLCHHVAVECVRDENRDRFKALGVRTVIRPVRTYPEIMVRAVVAPGSEKVLEDLFDYQHDHPHRYEVTIDDLSWADVVSALIRHDIGTALAYIDHNGDVICHPPANSRIKASGLIVLVRSADTPHVDMVEEALNHHRHFLSTWHAIQEENKAAQEREEREERAARE